MTCPVCNDTGWQVIHTGSGDIKLPCPVLGCSNTKTIFWGIGEKELLSQAEGLIKECENLGIGKPFPSKPKRTKTTTIPDAGLFCPDDDDNRLVDSCDVEVEDTITDTTIEDILK